MKKIWVEPSSMFENWLYKYKTYYFEIWYILFISKAAPSNTSKVKWKFVWLKKIWIDQISKKRSMYIQPVSKKISVMWKLRIQYYRPSGIELNNPNFSEICSLSISNYQETVHFTTKYTYSYNIFLNSCSFLKLYCVWWQKFCFMNFWCIY